MTKPKVLLVADDDLLLSSMKSMMDKTDYEVMLCGDLSDAKNLSKEFIVRSIVIEKDFPIDELITFIVTVKSELPKPGIIILSDCENEINLLRAGADDWLIKPFKMPIFLAKLAVLCR